MSAKKTLLLSYRNKADDIWRHKVGLLLVHVTETSLNVRNVTETSMNVGMRE